MKDIKTYLKDIDEMSNNLLNKDQKEIIKRTILNMKKYGEKDIDIDHMFQMFIRKVY